MVKSIYITINAASLFEGWHGNVETVRVVHSAFLYGMLLEKAIWRIFPLAYGRVFVSERDASALVVDGDEGFGEEYVESRLRHVKTEIFDNPEAWLSLR